MMMTKQGGHDQKKILESEEDMAAHFVNGLACF